jgi:ferredoxin
LGFCIYECNDPDLPTNNLCGLVCPTGAILRLSRDEKVAWKLGTAYVDRSKCIPWVRDKNCGKCEENCPAPGKAIHFYEDVPSRQAGAPAGGQEAAPEGGIAEDLLLRRPYVLPDRCIGCGQCEYVCPVRGRAAIRVDRRQVE